MLRLLIYGVPGSPVFELAEWASSFHNLPFYTIEHYPEEIDSYFDDKIPAVVLDTGDFSSGSESQSMARDPYSMELDRVLDVPLDIGADDYKPIDDEDLAEVFQVKQGILVTEIPDLSLIRWSSHILFLNSDEENVVDWFNKRRKCRSCGNVHHLDEKPSRDPEICDRCGTDLIQLAEDYPDNVRQQFMNWRNEFWAFQKTSKKERSYKSIPIDKMDSFYELCLQTERWIRDAIEKENWYKDIEMNVGFNPVMESLRWNPVGKEFERVPK